MATYGSANTVDELIDAYADLAGYEIGGSVSDARDFIHVCRILLLKIPRQMGKNGATAQYSVELIHREMEKAECWVSLSDTTNNPQVIDLEIGARE